MDARTDLVMGMLLDSASRCALSRRTTKADGVVMRMAHDEIGRLAAEVERLRGDRRPLPAAVPGWRDLDDAD